jgi:hypothetical protein
MIALPISAAVESSVGDRNCHEKVVVGRRARLLSLALVVGAAFALAVGGCVQLACRPASILVAKKEERGRLDVGGGGLLRTTETGRVEEVQKPVVVREYWVLSKEGAWYRVSAEQFKVAEPDRPLEVCP